jgi:hypothetical protein
MSTAAAITVLGSVGVFPSRAFLPAFVTSCLLRFGHEIPLLGGTEFLTNLGATSADSASWFTHDLTLTVLLVLSLLELWAVENPDLRQLMDPIESGLKALTAFLSATGVLSTTDAATANAIQGLPWVDAALPLVAAGGVFGIARTRRIVWETLTEMDPDDSTGLQALLARIETFWVLSAFLILILVPWALIFAAALIFWTLNRIERRSRARIEESRLACRSCGADAYRSAPHCPSCDARMDAACAVGVFGQDLATQSAQLTRHDLDLLMKSRCGHCATPLPSRTPHQHCSLCKRKPFATPQATRRYAADIDSRLATTLALCGFLCLLPVLGALPALILYRLRIVSPYRRYLPPFASFTQRLKGRLLLYVVLLLQFIPLVGSIALVCLGAAEHAMNRRAFLEIAAR